MGLLKKLFGKKPKKVSKVDAASIVAQEKELLNALPGGPDAEAVKQAMLKATSYLVSSGRVPGVDAAAASDDKKETEKPKKQ